MITQTTCYVIECDECGTDVYDRADIDGTPHYGSDFAARAQIVACGDECGAGSDEFHERGDRLLCGNCAHRADCEARGHRWGRWFPTIQESGRFRYCDHCHVGEVDEIASRITPHSTPAGGLRPPATDAPAGVPDIPTAAKEVTT